jgi:acyl carrier protein
MSTTIEVIKRIVTTIKRTPMLASDLSGDTNLIEDVKLDSLELLQFMLEVEERLAIRIDFDALDFYHLQSIARLAEFLESMPPLPAQNAP